MTAGMPAIIVGVLFTVIMILSLGSDIKSMRIYSHDRRKLLWGIFLLTLSVFLLGLGSGILLSLLG